MEPSYMKCIMCAVLGAYILKRKTDEALAKAIAKVAQTHDVHKANAALPQFQVDNGTPENMLELLSRLDQAAEKSSAGPR